MGYENIKYDMVRYPPTYLENMKLFQCISLIEEINKRWDVEDTFYNGRDKYYHIDNVCQRLFEISENIPEKEF